MKRIPSVMIVLWLFLLGALPAAELKVSGVFGDHMVLQRDKPVPVWGWARAGETVAIEFAGRRKMAVADASGKWQVQLEAMPASAEPRTLTVSRANPNAIVEKLTVTDVLVGEVWLACGQSNMGWWLKETTTAAEVIPKAADPLLRLGRAAGSLSETRQTDLDACKWSASTPEVAAGFSAVGYFFGRDLRKALDVPVGILVNAWPASSAEAWTSLETLQVHPVLKHYLEASEKTVAKYVSGESGRAHAARMAKYREETAKAQAEGRPLPKAPSPLLDPCKVPWRPTLLFNSRIAPLIPFALRGVIWYQAEGNCGDPARYEVLFPAMVQSWRDGWKDPALPFLFVQLPLYRGACPEMREVQARCAKAVPHCGMVVTLDVGEADNIHPRNKEPVGARLALAARALVYGQPVAHRGPEFSCQEIRGDRLILKFDHAEGGLVARGAQLKGFEVAGADGQYLPAQATIEGQTVILRSPRIQEPKSGRYAWAAVPEANLFNQAGLPAEPFQTGALPPPRQ